MSKTVKLATVLAMILPIVGCGGSGQASDFNVTTLEGDEFSVADKRSEVVALYFMAAY
jgi:hypothetical protein